MKNQASELQQAASQIFNWWTRPEAGFPSEVRSKLLGTLSTKRISVYFASACVFLLGFIAFYRTGSLWPIGWVVFEIVLTGARLTVMHRSAVSPSKQGKSSAGPLMVLGSFWSIVFGLGCAACLANGLVSLSVVSGIAVTAIIVSISTRNAATPRFAILCMLAVGGPWIAVALVSPVADLALAGLLLPLLILGMIAVLYQNHRDLVRLIQAEEKNRILARTDPLTGLGNRSALFECIADLSTIVGKHTPLTKFSILSLDLDSFKAINDRYGHGMGDRLLQKVAQRIREAVRNTDTVYRIGGDEFVVVMPNADEDDTRRVALRIIERLSSSFQLEDAIAVTIGVSVGSTKTQSGSIEISRLLANSDKALYEAKRSGRAKYIAGEPTFLEDAAAPKGGPP